MLLYRIRFHDGSSVLVWVSSVAQIMVALNSNPRLMDALDGLERVSDDTLPAPLCPKVVISNGLARPIAECNQGLSKEG